MIGETEKIIFVTTEVTLYPKADSGTYLLCIPASVRRALELTEEDLEAVPLYIALRDQFGNLIAHRLVHLESGPEVNKRDFERQLETGQLYPGQRIRLEVSRALSS